TLDRKKARELFASVTRPILDPRPCEDPLIGDASAYYELAAAISQSVFDADEKAAEAHVQFLAAILLTAKSPNELAPFLRALQSIDLKPPEREQLLSAVAVKFTDIGPDYRPFVMSLDALESELSRAMDTVRSRAPLVQGFRSYLVAQMNAPRCLPAI